MGGWVGGWVGGWETYLAEVRVVDRLIYRNALIRVESQHTAEEIKRSRVRTLCVFVFVWEGGWVSG